MKVKVYRLERMGQNFDQAKRDDTFLPMPNILTGSVFFTISGVGFVREVGLFGMFVGMYLF